MIRRTILIALVTTLGAVLFAVLYKVGNSDVTAERHRSEVDFTISNPEYAQTLAALPAPIERSYWITKDPATGGVPAGIHKKGIAQARRLAERKTTSLFDWVEAGPDSLGGRVLTVAVDVANTDIVLAGAASGGVWKSFDEGSTWAIVTQPNDQFSVTTLAQDPRAGSTNVWYMAGGEYRGTAGSQQNVSAGNYALGVYKSIDNGDSWDLLAGGDAGDPASFDTAFDYVNGIVISPVTGTVFLSNNASGIYRSDDGGATFPRVLGTTSQHAYSTVDVGSDGTLVAVLSTLALAGTQSPGGGVYVSTDDGLSWSNITPPTFPAMHQRSAVAIAPSNPNIVYVLTMVNRPDPNSLMEDIRFHRIDLSTGVSEDRSANLPDFDGFVSLGSSLNTLRNYSMMLEVKPDDENFVIAGGIVPYRSRDGFATPLVSYRAASVGGYECADNSCFNFIYATHYPEHWNDQQEAFFNPDDPSEMWMANDGGVYVTRDINKTFVDWENLNRGLNTAQVFHVTTGDEAGDGRILMGLQDHGIQYILADRDRPEQIDHFSPGERTAFSDGATVYFSDDRAIIGLKNGGLHTLEYDNEDGTDIENFFEYIQQQTPLAAPPDLKPRTAGGFKFYVHPTALDPVDKKTFFYPDGSTSAIGATVYRNSDIDTGSSGQVLARWQRLDNWALPFGYLYTAFGTSVRPAHRLYMGASASFSVPSTPRIFRVDNATTETAAPREISIPNTPVGAYVHDIAVNPYNADEILVVMSNFKIIGLYHSSDGGQTYTAVEGNLEGENSSGPSLRAATILPLWDVGSVQTVYFVATSTGLYSTRQLNGMDTVWEQEATDLIGGVVVNDVVSRPSDGRVTVGSHGRGVIIGNVSAVLVSSEEPGLPSDYSLEQNYPNPFGTTTQITYTLGQASQVSLDVYDSTGRLVREIISGDVRLSGPHSEVVDLTSLSSGTYFYRLVVGPRDDSSRTFSEVKTMTLIR